MNSNAEIEMARRTTFAMEDLGIVIETHRDCRSFLTDDYDATLRPIADSVIYFEFLDGIADRTDFVRIIRLQTCKHERDFHFRVSNGQPCRNGRQRRQRSYHEPHVSYD